MRSRAIIILLGAIVFATGMTRAADSYSIGAPLPLQVWLRKEAAPYAEQRYTAFVTEGGNKFAFIVPPGYFLHSDPASGTLRLSSREGGSSISFALLDSKSSDGQAFDADSCRESVLRDFSSGKITHEFSEPTSVGEGFGFDLQWKASGSIVECKRVMFISSPAGVLELTATSIRDSFGTASGALNAAVMTLRFSADGVIKMPAIPSND